VSDAPPTPPAEPPKKGHVHRDASDDLKALLIASGATVPDLNAFVAKAAVDLGLTKRETVNALKERFSKACFDYEEEGGSCVSAAEISIAASEFLAELLLAHHERLRPGLRTVLLIGGSGRSN